MNNEENTETSSSARSALRAAFGLGLFAVITAGLIGLVQVNTSERIAAQETKARLAALYNLVPQKYRDNDLLADSFKLELNAGKASVDVYRAKRNDEVTAIILPWSAPDGYTAPISLLIAITQDGNLMGVRVVDHKETPGLGDKIELTKSNWILGFDQRSLQNTPSDRWRVKKDGGDFDQLTGATVTPRAIVSSVYEALVFYSLHATALNAQAPQTTLSLLDSQ